MKKLYIKAIEKTLDNFSHNNISITIVNESQMLKPIKNLPVTHYHSHQGWQLHTCLTGRYYVAFEEGAVCITPTSFLMTAPQLLHSPLIFTEDCPKEKVELLQIHFNLTRCRVRYKSFDENYQRYLYPNENRILFRHLGMTPNRFAEQVNITNKACIKDGIQDALQGWLQIYFHALLCTLSEKSKTKNSYYTELVDRALFYIHKNIYKQQMKCEDVAKYLKISTIQLRKIFKLVTGKSLWETVVEIRLEAAHRLILKGEHNIKEIAYLTGWKNQLYFSTVFKKHYNDSPSNVMNNRVPGNRI